MVDLHSHILPGLDDGAPDLHAATEMARAALEDGTRKIAATPHVSLDYDTAPEAIEAGVASLRRALSEEGIALEITGGAEVAVARVAEIGDEALARLCLGEGAYLLVESPYSYASSPFLEQVLFDLQTRGFRPLLAHPERCAVFQHDRKLLERLTGQGVLCSVTAGSLVGSFGRDVRRFTLELLRSGLVHNLASDAHDTARRPPGLTAGLEALRSALPELAGQADWLAHDAPAAIAQGQPLPDRPAPAQRPRARRWGLGRRR